MMGNGSEIGNCPKGNFIQCHALTMPTFLCLVPWVPWKPWKISFSPLPSGNTDSLNKYLHHNDLRPDPSETHPWFKKKPKVGGRASLFSACDKSKRLCRARSYLASISEPRSSTPSSVAQYRTSIPNFVDLETASAFHGVELYHDANCATRCSCEQTLDAAYTAPWAQKKGREAMT